MRKTVSAAIALLVVWGCDSDTMGLSDGAKVRVSFALMSGASSSLSVSPTLFANEAVLFGNVPVDAISAINVNVTGVAVRAANEGSWMSFGAQGGGQQVELLGLATNASGAQLLTQDAALEPGDYKLRLMIGDASLTLSESICLGGKSDGGEGSSSAGGPPCLEPGDYEAIVPSGGQTGVKMTASFSIDNSGTDPVVLLTFDEDATLANVTYSPGKDAFMVAPVIHGPRNGDSGGGS